MPAKWIIPENTIITAHSYITFWADGNDDFVRVDRPNPNITTPAWYHLNFKLSKDGEEIALFDPNLVLVDSVTFGQQISDVSFGRQPDGGENWYYFGDPTPRSTNSTMAVETTEFARVARLIRPGEFIPVKHKSIFLQPNLVVLFTIPLMEVDLLQVLICIFNQLLLRLLQLSEPEYMLPINYPAQ